MCTSTNCLLAYVVYKNILKKYFQFKKKKLNRSTEILIFINLMYFYFINIKYLLMKLHKYVYYDIYDLL